MRIGLGGSALGLRGGISNQGFGVGVGPFSAGSSWGRRRRSSRDGGGFFAFLALVVSIAWPWWLGTFIAVKLGAADPSTARTVVGWIFEVPWLVFVCLLVAGWMRQRSESAAADAEFRAVRAVTGPGGKTCYHRAACTVNHRTPQAAQNCNRG